MKTIKMILTVVTLGILCPLSQAQKCHGENIRVYKGGTGCGCHCLKECVTPDELPVYLADGWNTEGCWNCCKRRWWVDAGIPKTSLDEVHPNAKPGSLTVSFTLASESTVKIHVADRTGRYVATVADEYRVDVNNELIWDESTLSPGVNFLTIEAGDFRETRKIAILN
jgi:hypothetical protein